MRRMLLACATVAALSLATAGVSLAQEAVTVKGEVVDLACYLAKGKRGAEHRSCAQMCAKGGVPMGLLTDSGDLYLLIDDHANKKPYEDALKLAGSNAEISGQKYVKNGMSSIVVGEAHSD